MSRLLIPGHLVGNPDSIPKIIALPYSATANVYISSDLGQNWTTKTVIGSSNSLMSSFIKGNSVLIQRNGSGSSKGEYSTDLWENRYQTPGSAQGYPQGSCISGDGNVFGFTWGSTGYLEISTDKGQNWTQSSPAANLLGIAMNYSGSKIYLTSTSLNYLKYSTNYGSSWSYSGTIFGSSYYIYSVAMSDDGQIIYVGASNYGDRMAKSSNGGSSFGTPVLVGPTTSGSRSVRMYCSNDGKYVLFHSHLAGNWVSNDYGANWTKVLTNKSTTYNNVGKVMSDDGKYMIIGDYSVSGTYYISTDYGVNWTTQSISGVSIAIRSLSINY